jgi:ureidoacrylate peracid hydrolase
MHDVNIPQWIRDRIIAKYDREHVFETLEPAKTALVVIDMQNAFLLPGVAHALCPEAVTIVPNINRLAAAVRGTGGTVAWVSMTLDEAAIDAWAPLFEMSGRERSARRLDALCAGSRGHELWHELDVRPEDLHVVKNRYSAFLPGACDLIERLRARGIDTVLITGTVTNVCCDSSARDAMQLGFRTIMVTDANAAMTDEEHNAALISFYNAFGDIMPTDLVIACLRPGAAKSLAAAE